MEKINQYYQNEQKVYFSFLEEAQDSNVYTELISKNMFKISMKDQISILQLLVLMKEKSKEICEKYNLIIEDSEED